MDCIKVGKLIRKLRLEQNLTQKQLAEKINLSDKTISKWERGCGLPDISILSHLSTILNINIDKILDGELDVNDENGGNMKKIKYFVCITCGNISTCTGDATVSCCSKTLNAITPQKASNKDKLSVEQIENEWYITGNHPMTKEKYITFVALATSDKLYIHKTYPEWELSLRIPRVGHGMLIWYSTSNGLLYQFL